MSVTIYVPRYKRNRREERYKMKAVTYNFHPKHILEPNGLFEWERTTDVECYCCGHKQSSHLDGVEVCLKGLCLCEKFGVDKKEVISPKAIARKNLPKKFSAHFDRH
jgi:hypothetical protein